MASTASSKPKTLSTTGLIAADSTENAALRLTLEQALARLTPKQRAVIVLRFYDDRSVEEAAAIMGCSTGTVKSQTSYALGRLRKLIPDLAVDAPGARWLVPFHEVSV